MELAADKTGLGADKTDLGADKQAPAADKHRFAADKRVARHIKGGCCLKKKLIRADFQQKISPQYKKLAKYLQKHIKLTEMPPHSKAYWTACQIIKNFKGALGAEAAAGLIEELKFMYPKRTALLEELGKIV